ncbi:MAG TPA: hypothetical protein P5511_03990 [Candidatus Goldiibacteriota bacterium]|nr:hypothetical protein [Candidatus Goldiibacteriota bacterium]
MKRTIIFLAVSLAFAGFAAAHPPSDIAVSSDVKSGEVKLSVAHKVKDAAQHYIYEIVVKVNGKQAVRQDAVTQTSADSQEVVYVIPGLKEGDKIEVYAECNKMGDMKKTFAAGSEKAEKKGK